MVKKNKNGAVRSPKGPSVDASVFLRAVRDGHAAGKSHKEIAAELGMKLGTFSVRCSNYRKAIEAEKAINPAYTGSFPSFGGRGTPKGNVVNLAAEIFGELAGLDKAKSSVESEPDTTDDVW